MGWPRAYPERAGLQPEARDEHLGYSGNDEGDDAGEGVITLLALNSPVGALGTPNTVSARRAALDAMTHVGGVDTPNAARKARSHTASLQSRLDAALVCRSSVHRHDTSKHRVVCK